MSKRVDVLFKMESMPRYGTYAKSEKLIRQIDTDSTTFGRLQEMARFQLNIGGELALWLVHEDSSTSLMKIGVSEPISKLITKDSTLHVEKLHVQDKHEHLDSSEKSNIPSADDTHFAWLPTNGTDSKGIDLDGVDIGRLLSNSFADTCGNPRRQKSFKKFLPSTSMHHPPGELHARASNSQIGIEGGQSASTAMCLHAAVQLLERILDTSSCITSDNLDAYLQCGSTILSNLELTGGDDIRVHDLWNHPVYSEIVKPLQRGTTISGTASQPSFQKCLWEALCFAQWKDKQSVALVVTQSPKTILLVCKDVHHGAPWFLLDSHGSTSEIHKKAFFMQFNSMQIATAALLQKFTNAEGLGDSLPAQHVFEAYAIVFNPVVEDDESRLFGLGKDDDSMKCPASSWKTPKGQQSMLQDQFRDSITGELFADPVFCDRGHTHERSSIERHFHARREMKAEDEERLDQSQDGTIMPGQSCGAGRNFDPTCPLTGEPISDILINNDQCDRMVQLLVESWQLTLDDGELEDWKERRKQKIILAQERRAQAKSQSLDQNKQTGSEQESELKTKATVNADTVLIHGKTVNRVGRFILGVAIALCPSDWEQPASTSQAIARCRNSCCRSRLQTSNQGTCARCAQTLCSTCLLFQVKEADQRHSDALENEQSYHPICPECVLQILQVVRTGSATESDRVNSLRFVEEMDEIMKQFFASFMKQKAELQHQVLHNRIHKSFVTDAAVLNQRIEELQGIRTTLETDIRHAHEQATAAKIDGDESLSENAEDELRLQSTLLDIEAELNSIDWKTEEGMIRGSLLEHQQNEALTDLGVAKSLRTHTTDITDEKTHKFSARAEHMKTLESRCAAVATEHDALVAKGPSEEDDDEFTLRLSELTHTHDQLSMELIQALEDDAAESTKKTPDLSETRKQIRMLESQCVAIVTEHDLLVAKGPSNEHDDEFLVRVDELTDMYDKLSMELVQAKYDLSAEFGENTPTLSGTTSNIKALESKCAAISTEHDELVSQGPSNEHDHEFTSRVDALSELYDQLLMELVQAKEDLEKYQEISKNHDGCVTGGDDCECENFASADNRDSSTIHSRTGDDVLDDAENTNVTSPSVTTDDVVDMMVPTLNESTTEIAMVDLAAIGVIGVEEVTALPLELRYPSVQMCHQVLVLRNHLELARVDSGRVLDEYYGGLCRQLQARVEDLEDDLVTLRREVTSAQAIAEEEERLAQERMARRTAAALERKRLDEERAVEARRLREEQARLEAIRRKEEDQTRQSLQGLDLRRCGNPDCGFGPFERIACTDMEAHNDVFTFIDSNGRRQTRKRNECPMCQWTNKDWNAWPRFVI